MAYMGDPILIAHVVLWPDRSIIKQSYDARERLSNPDLPQHLCHGNLNGDGFGIGWYSDRPDLATDEIPCVFTSVTPAWNNDNLTRLASKIASPLFFAHVRAAYPGMPVSEQNCHPFQYGRYLWMHNGNIGGFDKVRRPLVALLSDAAYEAVPSFHSDSSIAFGLFLHFLPHLDRKLSPDILLKAMEQTISKIAEYGEKYQVTEVSLLNFVVSDGATMIATRCAFPLGEKPASLYYAEGNTFRPKNGTKPWVSSPRSSSISKDSKYELTYAEQGSGVAFIASEPITGHPADWVEVPHNHALIITREKSGIVNIMRSPLTETGTHPRQNEVSSCLEAVSRGIQVTARTWSEKMKTELLTHQTSDIISISEKEDDRISGHSAATLCLAVDRSRDRLFGSMTDGTVNVWDLKSHKLLFVFDAHEDPVLKIVLSDQYLYTTGGHQLRVWDLETYTCIYSAQMQPGEGTLWALAVSRRAVYVGGQDARVKLFNLKPSNLLNGLEVDEKMDWSDRSAINVGHLSAIHCLEICGKYICSAGGDSVVRVWDRDTLALVRVLRGHRGSVLTCKGYGNILLSGGRDNTIRVWDMESFISRRALTGHKNDVLSIAFLCPEALKWNNENNWRKERRSLSILSTNGSCIVASCSADCTVRLWSMSTWACIQIFNLIRTTPFINSPIQQNSTPCEISPFAQESSSNLISSRSSKVQDLTPLSVALTRDNIYIGTRSGNIHIWNISELVRSLDHEFEDFEEQLEATSFPRSDTELKLENGMIESATRSILETELIEKLSEFIMIRTIRAKFLAKQLESLGADVKLAKGFEDKNPVVIGRLGDQDQEKPTITFYGHYDVQPAEEANWRTDPFEVHARDGYLYGRGVSDNKGPILAFVYAIKELIETKSWNPETATLPMNIAFLFEGEEENGSKGTLEAIKENLHWFNNNILTIISNTQWVGENVPCLTYGMRGMISLDISVFGPKHDLHSGNDGGVCNEPMVDLVKLLATLVDSHSDICVPGFYDDVASNLLDAAWTGLESCDEFSPEGYQSTLGIPGLTVSTSKMDILRARWCKPTLSVVDMRSSGMSISQTTMDHYRFGPTRFSVIPCHAVGKVSIRFVPRQDKEKMISCVKNHVEHEFAKLRSKNTVSVNVVTSGDWWEAKMTSKYFSLAKEAICKEWGRHPLTVREGGTMPLASSLEKLLGANALLIPMGQASDHCHLANERIRKLNLMKGKDVIKNLLESISAQL
eukprot:g7320.t1